jgi:hypothetical protein
MNLKSVLMSPYFSLKRTKLKILLNKAEEGVRRAICDMILLIFHLVLSSFTFDCADISVASKFANGI